MTLLGLRLLIARARCAITGHTRGARLDSTTVHCRRCGSAWKRLQRKKAA